MRFINIILLIFCINCIYANHDAVKSKHHNHKHTKNIHKSHHKQTSRQKKNKSHYKHNDIVTLVTPHVLVTQNTNIQSKDSEDDLDLLLREQIINESIIDHYQVQSVNKKIISTTTNYHFDQNSSREQPEKNNTNLPTNNQYNNNIHTLKINNNLPNNHKLKLYSYAAIAVNANTHEILISKNSHAQLPIASITKLMTATIVLDARVDLNEYITISADDIDILRNTYSRLKVGMKFTRKDLLLLALMSSENRAAHALARTTFHGGLHVFINAMNKKADQLGMFDTKFYDPTGLTNKNVSTVFDIAKLVEAAYYYQDIRNDTTTKNADVMFAAKYVHRYVNTDALVRSKKIQINLSKTGFINEAGHCLAIYSIVNNKPIIMVFLNSAGKSGRLIDAMTIKNYIDHNNTRTT